ncbi:MAG: condensation domain-containing protein [Knoellia sp.]
MPDVVADVRSSQEVMKLSSHPLTFSQSFLTAVGSDGSGCADGHVIGVTVQVDERMERERLQQALNRVVAHHTSLRSHIGLDDTTPRMVIDPPAQVELLVEAALDDDEAAQARALQVQESLEARGISLTDSPLIRASLVHTDARSWLGLVLHHVAGDAHALAVVMRDVLAAYDDALGENDGETYADFAFRQAALAASDGWADDIDWWRQQLAGASLATAPGRADLPFGPGSGGPYVAHVFHLDPSLTERVMTVCLTRGTTPFSVLMAAFVHTARAHMSEDATSFMTIASGRDSSSRDTVGTFFNHVPVAVPHAPSAQPLDLVDTVHHAWESARSHEAPFRLLVENGVEGIDFSKDPTRVPVTFEWIPPAPHWRGSRTTRQVPSVPGESPSADLPMGALWLMRLNDLDALEGVLRYSPTDVTPEIVLTWIAGFRDFLERACPA